MNNDPTIIKLMDETSQSPKIRQDLVKRIEEQPEFKDTRIILYFTSFIYPVMIDDTDVDIIEGVLQKTDKSKKLCVILNSPGGDGLAAERIIKVCRSYSNDGFSVLVPKMAKSATTMIAMGSNKVYMSDTSELGPIDPQTRVGQQRVSVYSIVESYKKLLSDAIGTKGRIEPYLQQLSNYNPIEVKQLEALQELSEDIAISALKSGMMSSKSKSEIRRKIKMFLIPETTKVHGRAIYPEVASKAGLSIKVLDHDSKIWELCWELYIRADYMVGKELAKIVETSSQHFSVGAPR